jgi:hypothetical protein
MLIAAGAIGFERWTLKGAPGPAPRSSALTWVRPALVAYMVVFGALLLPYTLSILSPPKFIAYMDVIGIRPPASETHRQSPLPQQYADMFGWREMTDKVAVYYNALPADERAKTAIFGNNYGEAGAIDFFGPKYGLPKAISGHQNYWYWGPRNYTGESVIIIGGRRTQPPLRHALREPRHLALPRHARQPATSLAQAKELGMRDNPRPIRLSCRSAARHPYDHTYLQVRHPVVPQVPADVALTWVTVLCGALVRCPRSRADAFRR